MRNLLLHRWPAVVGSIVVFSSVSSHPPASLAHGPRGRRNHLVACLPGPGGGEQSRAGEIQFPGRRTRGWDQCCPFPSPTTVLTLRHQLRFGGEMEDVMFQEAQHDEGATLIHFEPHSAERRPDSPKRPGDQPALEQPATVATSASRSRLT